MLLGVMAAQQLGSTLTTTSVTRMDLAALSTVAWSRTSRLCTALEGANMAHVTHTRKPADTHATKMEGWERRCVIGLVTRAAPTTGCRVGTKLPTTDEAMHAMP